MSEQSYLEIEGNQFAFVRFGNGPKLMIAFPGYGARKEQFLQLTEALSDSYVVYALDLPGHGESTWKQNEFSLMDFEKVIQMIVKREAKSTVSLMGYSFGGRAILSLFSDLKASIDEIILLAPDGLDEGYFKRATFLPVAVRKLLQRFLKNPNWYVSLVGVLSRIGLLKKYSYEFVKLNFANPERKKRLFLYWNAMDSFKFNPEEVKNLLNESGIPLQIILGKRDDVIPRAAWKEWVRGLDQVQLTEIDAGHRLIGATLNAHLKKI